MSRTPAAIPSSAIGGTVVRSRVRVVPCGLGAIVESATDSPPPDLHHSTPYTYPTTDGRKP